MEVILLERIAKLGQMGDTVRVRDGYARNFLLPQGKALRATEANQKRFEEQRAQLETRNLELRKEAEAVAAKMSGHTIVVIRQAGERGQLYGSVSTRDIADALTESGFSVGRAQVVLHSPIKELGLTEVPIQLHPEVEANIVVNVARTPDEAERQARGAEPTATEEEEAAEAAAAAAAEFFEDADQGEQAVEETLESLEQAAPAEDDDTGSR
jgi:large subunit ribosomal protein L9